uniref:Ketosynthase family 3 (KS3) domain-containing protein n=1 Tax=Biomphalaria glabrata TaxID=6526 RepID=A0A2C9LRE9_BIOGL
MQVVGRITPKKLKRPMKPRPSIVVDTACSSSHHAFDYAYRCLRDGIIDTAIVGGLMLDGDPLPFLQYVKSGFLSPDRQCKSFDASGNGFTKAEGGAIFVLQRRRN